MNPPQIPGLEFISLAFFESGQSFIAKEHRRYSGLFPQRTTRGVVFEITLRNLLYRRVDQTHRLGWRYYNPDRSVLREAEDDWTIKSDDEIVWNIKGLGSDQPGRWMPGTYWVEILINGVTYAAASFTIE